MASAVLHGPRNVSEERSHLVCRAQIPLIVDSKESARVVQLYAMPNCRKQVLNLTIIRSGVTNTVGDTRPNRLGWRCGRPHLGERVTFAFMQLGGDECGDKEGNGNGR